VILGMLDGRMNGERVCPVTRSSSRSSCVIRWDRRWRLNLTRLRGGSDVDWSISQGGRPLIGIVVVRRCFYELFFDRFSSVLFPFLRTQ
jgi:hypothetical protein